ncbi:hypothetical protein [Rhodospirillum sp. A1_3_36]|uniref:hypothetical protein n=1 Tax=Rhodospirillum sp. A1_3_36 TaxID=3391666 RepID=UPI0039A4A116
MSLLPPEAGKQKASRSQFPEPQRKSGRFNQHATKRTVDIQFSEKEELAPPKLKQ